MMAWIVYFDDKSQHNENTSGVLLWFESFLTIWEDVDSFEKS